MQTVESKEFTLPNRVINVVPVKRKRGNMDVDHENNFLFGSSSNQYVAKINRNGVKRSPLTPQETEFFENSEKSGLPFKRGDLSVHNKVNNFWEEDKTARIRMTGKAFRLDLSIAMDYILYKILLSNEDKVCPDPAWLTDSRNKITYKYCIEPENYKDISKEDDFDKNAQAWAFVNQISNNKTEMINFLAVLYPNKILTSSASMTDVKAKFQDAIKTNINKFIQTLNTEDRTLIATVRRAIKEKHLLVEGLSHKLPTGDVIGNNFNEVIEYLKNPANQEVLDILEARLEG